MKPQKKHYIDLHDTLKEKNDIIFLGSRESGKTSLAHKIAISCADGVSDEIRVPAIIDMRDTPLTFNLKKGILTYYNVMDEGIDTHNIQKCIREKYNEIKFLIILDNFDETNQKHLNAINKMVLSRKILDLLH
ncbi:predicted NTPase [Acetobacter orientalis]|uniref:Predicted NTPase n=1 Tax=Acetobacter orientalis TaxID=146474 RepID=A0A2Z5ZHP3_9PROT|nr:predicted NTPase [Acetobacter orientalis]